MNNTIVKTTETTKRRELGELVTLLAVQTGVGDQRGPSLLRLLRDAKSSGAGSGSGGGSAANERLMFDVEAFTIYEDVDGQIASAFNTATDERPHRSPEVNLLAWFAVFTRARERGELNAAQLEVAIARAQSWANRIEGFLERPTVKELTLECPRCGKRYWLDREGVRHSALYIQIRKGHAIEAQCRACPAQWVGDQEMVGLGRELGIEIDVDAVRSARSSGVGPS